MARILFHYSRLNNGGAEKSTLRLINALAERNHDVTLVLNVGEGTLEKQIDKRVRKVILFKKPLKAQIFSRKSILGKLGFLLFYSIHLITGLIIENVKKLLFLFDKRYDLAIISLQGLSPFFVCRIVHASKRMLYIRSDLGKIKKQQIAHNIKQYSKEIDLFLCVSQTVKDSTKTIHQEVYEKSIVLYNIIEIDSIIQNARIGESPYSLDGKLNLVTVCRMSDVSKGIYRQLEVIKKLVESGYLFNFYFVGDGADLLGFKEKAKRLNLNQCVYFIGEKNNPYPYIYHSDLVCVLSYYEGLSGVVNEAKILGKPVIATEFSGIREQIVNGENGIIVKNELSAIYEGLKMLLDDENKLKTISNDVLSSGIKDNMKKIELLESLCY